MPGCPPRFTRSPAPADPGMIPLRPGNGPPARPSTSACGMTLARGADVAITSAMDAHVDAQRARDDRIDDGLAEAGGSAG